MGGSGIIIMINDGWRQNILDDLILTLKNMDGFVSLSVFGSMANNDTLDIWSDIDALLVVEDESINHYFPRTDWIEKNGKIFTIQQSSSDRNKTSKIIYDDFRKIDLIITTKSKVLEGKPFWSKQNILFSNSDLVSKRLESESEDIAKFDDKNYQISKLSDEFWFIAYTALTKIMRNDLLIGFHLTLDLYKICLVLAMWIRDKETGTNIHRVGGTKNELIEELDIKINDFSKKGLIMLINKCSKEFDTLSSKWDDNYTSKVKEFGFLIDTALEKIEQS